MFMNHVFQDFNVKMTDPSKANYVSLEEVASRMIRIFGDYGLFEVMPPVDSPNILVK